MLSSRRTIIPPLVVKHSDHDDQVRALHEVVTELAERVELLETRERIAESRSRLREAGATRVFE